MGRGDNVSQPPELPTINEAILDANTLSQLFEDVSRCTHLIEVIVKRGPGRKHRTPHIPWMRPGRCWKKERRWVSNYATATMGHSGGTL